MIIICGMAPPHRLVTTAAAAALLLTSAAACSSTNDTAAPKGDCPVNPVKVTVSVDQWTDMVTSLAGDCAVVQTVVESTATDPHEFEPTPADTAKLTNANLVVVNGLGYDEWATKAADAASPRPAVVDAAEATGRTEGSNPHVWYDPAAQQKVAVAVTGALTKLQPDAATYLQSRSSIWAKDQVPYRQAVDRTSMVAKGRTYAATEPVAEYLADALGMTDVTPKGFAQAAANETEPSPGDVTELLQALRTGKVDVLLVNSQVEGQLNRQLIAAAKAADVAVVTVTETQPPGSTDFVKWQVFQLDELAGALQTAPS
jgi:zinc/manganese transport system substrate-binding protein